VVLSLGVCAEASLRSDAINGGDPGMGMGTVRPRETLGRICRGRGGGMGMRAESEGKRGWADRPDPFGITGAPTVLSLSGAKCELCVLRRGRWSLRNRWWYLRAPRMAKGLPLVWELRASSLQLPTPDASRSRWRSRASAAICVPLTAMGGPLGEERTRMVCASIYITGRC
jgi:hypothetical protein